MSIPPAGAPAPQGASPDDRAQSIAEAANHLRSALAIIDDADASKEAAAYIQTALDCLGEQQAT